MNVRLGIKIEIGIEIESGIKNRAWKMKNRVQNIKNQPESVRRMQKSRVEPTEPFRNVFELAQIEAFTRIRPIEPWPAPNLIMGSHLTIFRVCNLASLQKLKIGPPIFRFIQCDPTYKYQNLMHFKPFPFVRPSSSPSLSLSRWLQVTIDEP